MKRIIIILVLLFTSCSSALIERKPSSLNRLGSNPFEILHLSPSATTIEIERNTISSIERITGWNFFDLTKYTDEQRILEELTTLTESNQKAVKKVMDSYFLLSELQHQKGFKVRLGAYTFNLGKIDKSLESIDQSRDIQIFYKDESGEYHIKWVDDPKMGSAYRIEYRARAKDFKSALKIKDLKIRVKELPKKLSSLGEFAAIQNEIKLLLHPMALNQTHNLKVMNQLQIELRLRYSLPSVPLSNELLNDFKKFNTKSCNQIMKLII